jgi:uncharacterized protein YciI
MATFVGMLEFTEDEQLRLQTRPAHREYLATLLREGRLWMSGPWADETGALLIYRTDDIDEARRLLEADPYRQAGVLSNATIKEWRIVMGAPEIESAPAARPAT